MNDYITIALPKGKLFDRSASLLARVGWEAEGVSEDSRKLVIADLPTYVEYGAADIGIIGKDVLREEEKDVYELLDLGFGRCRLMMAVPEAKLRPEMEDYAHLRVATKYPRCAKEFFDAQGIQMDIVKLNGSIELGPLIGLAECIVDIVETGTTIRENKLAEVACIFPSTARLIANPVSFKLKFDRLHGLVEDLQRVLQEEKEGKEGQRK